VCRKHGIEVLSTIKRNLFSVELKTSNVRFSSVMLIVVWSTRIGADCLSPNSIAVTDDLTIRRHATD